MSWMNTVFFACCFFCFFSPADPLPPLQHPPRLLPLWAARWPGWTQTALLPVSMLAPLARPHTELQWWAGRRPGEVAKWHHADEEGTNGVQSGSQRVSTVEPLRGNKTRKRRTRRRRRTRRMRGTRMRRRMQPQHRL